MNDPARGGGVTGLADRDGAYTVFNVPAGPVGAVGYEQGNNLRPETATVSAGQIAGGAVGGVPGPGASVLASRGARPLARSS